MHKTNKKAEKSQPPHVPAAPPTSQLPNPQTVSMKLPRAEPPKWPGLSYDFYLWIASIAKIFKRSRWDDAAKTQGILQTIPIEKQSAFVHIDSW